MTVYERWSKEYFLNCVHTMKRSFTYQRHNNVREDEDEMSSTFKQVTDLYFCSHGNVINGI